MTELSIAGTWTLNTWRKMGDDGNWAYPFGKHPRGILIYAQDGGMAVQMVVADRPKLDTADPIGGSAEERAGAYSSCLSYFGAYEVQADKVIHKVDAALFPNWSDTEQARPFVFKDNELVLQVKDAEGNVTSEILWERKAQSAAG